MRSYSFSISRSIEIKTVKGKVVLQKSQVKWEKIVDHNVKGNRIIKDSINNNASIIDATIIKGKVHNEK